MQVANGQYALSDEGDIFLMSESLLSQGVDSPIALSSAEVTGLVTTRRRSSRNQKVLLTVTIGQLSFSHLGSQRVIPRDLIDLYMEDFFWDNDFYPEKVEVKDEFTFSCTLTRLDGSSFTRSELKCLNKGLKGHAKDRYNFRLVELRNEQEALVYEG